MKRKTRTNSINDHDGGPFVSASREPLPGEAQRMSGTTVALEQLASTPAPDPQEKTSPAILDKHHGIGGNYVIVDGARVPADEDGNPKK